MKYSFQCPKCKSTDVLEVKGTAIPEDQKISLTKWQSKRARIDRYICVSCGFTEEYVQLTDSFKKWAEKELDKQNRSYDDYV